MSLDQELRDVLAEQAAQCEVPPPDLNAMLAGGTRRRQRSRRITLTAAAAVVLAIVGGVAAWGTHMESRSDGVTNNPDHERTDHAQTDASLYFLDLDTRERTPAENFSPGSEYAFSPDGSRVACSGLCWSGSPGLYVANSDGTHVVELHVPSAVDKHGNRVDAETPFWELLWSPDGTKLLYQLIPTTSSINIGNLVLHDVATDETTVLTDFGLEEMWTYTVDFDFSPDGQSVIYHLPQDPSTSTAFDLWSVPTNGGAATLVLRDASIPGYLADGQRIAYVNGGHRGSSISIASLGDRQLIPSTSGTGYPWPLRMSPDRSKILYLTLGTTGQGTFIVDVATGETSHVFANHAAWVGDDTLLVGCIPSAPAPGEEPTKNSCS